MKPTREYLIVYCQMDVIPKKKRQVRTVHERLMELPIDETVTPDLMNEIERKAWKLFDDKELFRWRTTTGRLYVVKARAIPCEPLVIEGKTVEGSDEIEVINFFASGDPGYYEQLIFKQRV